MLERQHSAGRQSGTGTNMRWRLSIGVHPTGTLEEREPQCLLLRQPFTLDRVTNTRPPLPPNPEPRCQIRCGTRRSCLLLVFVAALLNLPLAAWADVALVVEDPAGYKGFLSDSGHLAIWVSEACVQAEGRVVSCPESGGVVLSSTSKWAKQGWAAIPAPLYFDGLPGKNSAETWEETMSGTYRGISSAFGGTYVNHLRRRGAYILRIHTAPEQDRHMLDEIQAGRDAFRYTYFSNNCSDLAREVLNLYFPGRFQRRFWPDFGLTTPRTVANRFWQLGQQTPELRMRVYYLPPKVDGGRLHNGPTKGICEAAATDLKYAVPLVFFQPVVYAAFGACYVAVDRRGLLRQSFRRNPRTVGRFAEIDPSFRASLVESPGPERESCSAVRLGAAGSPGAGGLPAEAEPAE